MTIKIEKTETAFQEIELPNYGVLLNNWFYKLVAENLVMLVTPDSLTIGEPSRVLKHCHEFIKACEPEMFYVSLANMLGRAEYLSGISMVTLNQEESKVLTEQEQEARELWLECTAGDDLDAVFETETDKDETD